MRYHERMIMLQIGRLPLERSSAAMDHLKEGTGLRGYGQRDPLVDTRGSSYDLFEDMRIAR